MHLTGTALAYHVHRPKFDTQKTKNYCFKINNFKTSKTQAGFICSALAGKGNRGSRMLGHPQTQLQSISNKHTLLEKKLSVYILFVNLEKFMIQVIFFLKTKPKKKLITL